MINFYYLFYPCIQPGHNKSGRKNELKLVIGSLVGLKQANLLQTTWIWMKHTHVSGRTRGRVYPSMVGCDKPYLCPECYTHVVPDADALITPGISLSV